MCIQVLFSMFFYDDVKQSKGLKCKIVQSELTKDHQRVKLAHFSNNFSPSSGMYSMLGTLKVCYFVYCTNILSWASKQQRVHLPT